MTHLAALLRRAGAWGGAEGRSGSVAWPAPAVVGAAAGAALAGATSSGVDPLDLASGARQVNGTTCGAAVLTMLAALGDPALAAWLATGRLPAGKPLPTELSGASLTALDALADAPPARRFAAVQRVYHRRATSGALLGLPWPTSLGTPPWGAARVARFPGVAFGHHPVDDADAGALAAALDGVDRALDAGVPVPLYSGGDTARGWRTAVPRHVVLAVGRTRDGLRVFEPGAGAVVPVTRAALLAGQGPQRALGGWAHLVWVLPPRPVRDAVGPG